MRTPASIAVTAAWIALCLLLPAAPVHEASSPSDAPDLRLTLIGPEEVVLGPDNPWQLHWMPDGHMAFLKADDLVHVWFAAEKSTYYFRGPSFDSLTPHQVISGTAVPVLSPSGAGFDRDYAGAGAVFRAANGSDLLMFYHAENQTCGGSYAYVSIALARSTDGGATWVRQGQIITSPEPPAPCSSPRFNGAGSHSAIVSKDGNYYYLYYMEWLTNQADAIRLARAPIAGDGMPGTWLKYHQGSFGQPGLGGLSDPVIQRPEPIGETGYAGIPSVSYNSALRVYLAVFTTHVGFYYATSPDGIQWSTARLLWSVPALTAQNTLPAGASWYYYPSLLSLDQPAYYTTGLLGYLYYAHGTRTETGNTAHYMVRRAVRFGYDSYLPKISYAAAARTPPAGQSIDPGGSFAPTPGWTWFCGGDFTLTLPSGSIVQLHDWDANTGLVVQLQPDSHVQVTAPWGGYCQPYDVGDISLGLQEFVQGSLTNGCDGGCLAVNVKQVTPDGAIASDYWLPAPPPSQGIPAGGDFTPTAVWTWICGGDFTMTRPDGNTVQLHDGDPTTGLIVVLQPNSQVVLHAPWSGYCQPFALDGVTAGTRELLIGSFANGCSGGCLRANIKEISPLGDIASDYWRP